MDWNTRDKGTWKRTAVAPLVGAWIEIFAFNDATYGFMSLLSWERGLKFFPVVHIHLIGGRSSRGSVDWNIWQWYFSKLGVVAPLVGAWIEIKAGIGQALDYVTSRSSRGSVDWNIGYQTLTATKIFVAPLVGAWIEITIFLKLVSLGLRRSSRGSVDWNFWGKSIWQNWSSRSSRGSVDWNSF